MQTLAQLQAEHEDERRALVVQALEMHGWTLTRAAEELGVFPSSLLRTIKRLDLEPEYLERSPRAGVGGRPPK
jgi:transcriptional regulator with GAF, ATPase, and Fis domain